MEPQFRKLFELYFISSTDKQRSFLQRFPERDWKFDRPSCRITSADGQTTLDVQLLGLEDQTSGDWRWIWHDSQDDSDSGTSPITRQLRSIGQKQAIETFTRGATSLKHVTGQQLSLVALGLLEASAYWTHDEDENTLLFFIVPADQLTYEPNQDPNHVANTIAQAIFSGEIEHHVPGVQLYLESIGYSVNAENGVLRASLAGVSQLQASFDVEQRLTSLEKVTQS